MLKQDEGMFFIKVTDSKRRKRQRRLLALFRRKTRRDRSRPPKNRRATPSPASFPEYDKAMKIMTALKTHVACAVFLEPVRWKEWGLFDYPKIVKKPMDISTCLSKLKSGKYKTVKDWSEDVQLIWDNCKLYNQPSTHVYHRKALSMQEAFKRFLNENNLPEPLVNVRSTVAKPARTLANQLPDSVSLIKTTVPSTKKELPDLKPLSYDEMTELRSNIYELSSTEEILKILNIIKNSEEDSLVKNEEKDEYDIDLDSLKPKTLKKLQIYIGHRSLHSNKIRSKKFRRQILEKRLTSLNEGETLAMTDSAETDASSSLASTLLAAPKGQQMARMDFDTPDATIDDFSSSEESEEDDGEPILGNQKVVSTASNVIAQKVMTSTDNSLWNTNFLDIEKTSAYIASKATASLKEKNSTNEQKTSALEKPLLEVNQEEQEGENPFQDQAETLDDLFS